MDDDRTANEAGQPAPDAAAPTPPPKKPRKRWPWMMFGIIVVVPLLLLAIWTTIALGWSYSEGTRSGYIQKFSRKGWLCKTWEG
ncbi:MAG: hypothetical protein ABIY52_15215, partial [Gemmatimonadaceae bacterium]